MKNIIIIMIIIIFECNIVSGTYILKSGGVCECSSCSDCTDALDALECSSKVVLKTNIENVLGYHCINDPSGFNNRKIFDCEGHTITIKDFHNGIYLDSDNDRAYVKNCIIEAENSSVGNSGISIIEGSYVYLIDNHITMHNGIIMNDVDRILLDNNVIIGDDSELGISIYNTTYTTIDGNVIMGDFIYGIGLDYVENSVISNNEIFNVSYGIVLQQYNQENDFKGNVIFNATINGFRIDYYGNVDNEIKNNRVCESEIFDFVDIGVVKNYGTENTCDKTYQWRDREVYKDCFYECVHEDCTCDSCSSCEEKLNNINCERVILLNNIISESDEICINGADLSNFYNKFFDCEGNSIIGSYIDSYENDIGLYMFYDYGNTIINCGFTNFESGIVLEESNNNKIISSWSVFNYKDGIQVINSDGVDLQNVAVLNNSRNGLYVEGGSNIFVSGSSFNENGVDLTGYGIFLYSSLGVQVIGNQILFNKGGIYFSEDSANSRLEQNIICRNNERDVYKKDIWNEGTGNIPGRDNTCYTYINWKDEGVGGLTVFGCKDKCYQEPIIVETISPPPISPSPEMYDPPEPPSPPTIQPPFVYNRHASLVDSDTSEGQKKNDSIGEIEGELNGSEDAIVVVTKGLEGMGFKSKSSKILFAVLFKIIIDFVLVMKNLNWSIIVIINIFILFSFYIIGFIDLWIVILILIISVCLFWMNLRKKE